ncbi:MAG: hypothetical protein NTX44_09945 [Ignavibacteriales bacterium]|nr:hypothetical protein [Ignavibacteriales bacterium]
MFNPNNLSDLSSELENVLNTPVSEKILEQFTEKQRNLLAHLIHDWTQGKKVEGAIKNILECGKEKLKPREYSDKTKYYLETKLN